MTALQLIKELEKIIDKNKEIFIFEASTGQVLSIDFIDETIDDRIDINTRGE